MKKPIRKIIEVILSVMILITIILMGFKYVSDRSAESQYNSLRKEIFNSGEQKSSENGYSLKGTSSNKKPALENTETMDGEGPDNLVPERLLTLMDQYQDMKGWITIDDTHIDYPVMSSDLDYEYYLHRDIDGNYSFPGSIFLDNLQELDKGYLHVLYGHHMKNHTMFRDVAEFQRKSYFNSHSTGRIYVQDRVIHVRPLYCYHAYQDPAYRTVFDDASEAGAFLSGKTGQKLPPGNYFVLVTCSYFMNNERTYLILKET